MIQIQRLYKNNWFYLGHTSFRRKSFSYFQSRTTMFDNMFLIQGQIILGETIFDSCILQNPCPKSPPNFFLFDQETKKFNLQDINVDFDGFSSYDIIASF